MTTNPLHSHPLFIATLGAHLQYSGVKDVQWSIEAAENQTKEALDILDPPDADHAQVTPGSEREVDPLIQVAHKHPEVLLIPLSKVRQEASAGCLYCAAALAETAEHFGSLKVEVGHATPCDCSPIASAEAFAQLLCKHGFTSDTFCDMAHQKCFLEIEQSFATAGEELREENTRLAADLHEFKVMVDNERFAHQKSKDKLAEATAKLDAGDKPVRFEVFAEVLKQKQDAEEKLAEVTRERDVLHKERNVAIRERDEERSDYLEQRARATQAERERDDARKQSKSAPSQQVLERANRLGRERAAALARAEQAEKRVAELEGKYEGRIAELEREHRMGLARIAAQHNDELVVAFVQAANAEYQRITDGVPMKPVTLEIVESEARTLLAAGKLGNAT